MKRKFFPRFLFFVLAFLLNFSFITSEIIAQKMKKYKFENAYIEKTTTVKSQMMENVATEKIYITDWGNKEAYYKNETIKVGNRNEVKNTVSLTDGKWIITFDPKTKTGTKMANPFYDKFAGKSEKELHKMTDEITKGLGSNVKKVGTQELNGKLCDMYEGTTNLGGLQTMTKMMLYKNFVMKLDSEGMGIKTSEMVKIFKEGEKPDEKLMVVPSNIKVTEAKIPH